MNRTAALMQVLREKHIPAAVFHSRENIRYLSGYTGEGCPTIGSSVMITCGAKVLGDITVGDGAVIGANAVVVKDVEPGAVMGGVPAVRLK